MREGDEPGLVGGQPTGRDAVAGALLEQRPQSCLRAEGTGRTDIACVRLPDVVQNGCLLRGDVEGAAIDATAA